MQLPLARLCSAGRRFGFCTQSDRQANVIDLRMACSNQNAHSTDVAWSGIPVGCSWMFPGIAAEHSGSHHAKHMWHHTRRHAAVIKKYKMGIKLCCMVVETDGAP